MKKRSKTKIIISAVCIVLIAVAVALTYKYRSVIFPAVTDTKTETTETTEIPTETSTVTLPPTTSAESVSETEEGKTAVRNILSVTVPESKNTPSAFEAKLFNAINEKRKEKGLAALNWNGCLYSKAKIRSDEAVTLFSHTRPNGKKPSTVLSDDKIEFSLFGECLAKGTQENDAGVTLLINGFLRDESQSSAIFSKDYVYAATAVSIDENGIVHAVILLCNP